MDRPEPIDAAAAANPAPGFSRHPGHVVDATPEPLPVRVLAGDRVIADTRAALRVTESRHDTVWYLPPDDVDWSLLCATDTSTYCPFKGHASYYSIDTTRDGDDRLVDAVWSYRTPYDECRVLRDYLAFYPDRVTVEVGGRREGAAPAPPGG